MKKKIVILGSTGSIGKSTLEVIKKDKKNFDVILLSAKNNYRKLVKQAKELTKDDVEEIKVLEELEVQEEKADAQRRMAWVALWSMLIFTAIVFLPFFPDSRIKLLGELSALFYIGMAGIVGAYMGMTAYMSKR